MPSNGVLLVVDTTRTITSGYIVHVACNHTLTIMAKEHHQLCVQFENDQSFIDTLRMSWQPVAAERLRTILAGHCRCPDDEISFNTFNRSIFLHVANHADQFPKLFEANRHLKWEKTWHRRPLVASTSKETNSSDIRYQGDATRDIVEAPYITVTKRCGH